MSKALRDSPRTVVCILLLTVVLAATSCGSATTAPSAPISSPPVPAAGPTSEEVANLTADPASTSAVSPTPLAGPGELPSKGSPEAKVILVEFTGFQ
jgi:hypothetical protein